jgi:bifunctional non-homologous end joining protein LigD
VVVCRDGLCRIYSRNQREITGFPEVVAALTARVGDRHLVLDGEIAPDLDGAPSFGLLQRRLHVPRPSRALLAAVPAQLFLFGILAEDGQDLTGLPYPARRDRLQAWEFASAPVQTPPYWLDIAVDRVLAVSAANHLEGIVSRRIDSAYLPGRRSRSWVMTVLRKQADALVYGHIPGSGTTTGTFGALVLCAYDAPGRLVHIGSVGTGFTTAARRALRARLDELARPDSPLPLESARGRIGGIVRFVEPRIVGSVEYREFRTGALRHPSWRGVRTDIAPASVRVPLD